MLPLTSAARRWLLQVARRAVEAAGRRETMRPPRPPAGLPPSDRVELERPQAAFVTLRKQGRLRGCVGHTGFDTPLTRVVVEMAQAAAREDNRFPPVASDEVSDIQLEISVLSPFFPIDPDRIIPGTHGLMVRQGSERGLLLPQVASALHWDSVRFLRETCRKAGLDPDAWKHGALLEAFTAEVIAETDPGEVSGTAP